jgi:Kre9/KNH-like N-terminal Ig-like domain
MKLLFLMSILLAFLAVGAHGQTQLESRVPLTTTIPALSTASFYIDVQAGESAIIHVAYDLSNNVDLRLQWNEAPTLTSFGAWLLVSPLHIRTDACANGRLYVEVLNNNLGGAPVPVTITPTVLTYRVGLCDGDPGIEVHYIDAFQLVDPSALDAAIPGSLLEVTWVSPSTGIENQQVRLELWRDSWKWPDSIVTVLGTSQNTGSATVTLPLDLPSNDNYYVYAAELATGQFSRGENFLVIRSDDYTFPCSAEQLGVYFSVHAYNDVATGSTVEFCGEQFTAYSRAAGLTAYSVVYVSDGRPLVVVSHRGTDGLLSFDWFVNLDAAKEPCTKYIYGGCDPGAEAHGGFLGEFEPNRHATSWHSRWMPTSSRAASCSSPGIPRVVRSPPSAPLIWHSGSCWCRSRSAW